MSNEIDNITIEYVNLIDDVNLSYDTTITNIELAVGGFSQNVVSVNGMFGNINLTASATLDSVSSSGGIYTYIINHNLGYDYIITNIYDTSNNLVFGDVQVLDSASVTISSAVDLLGYKVVMQKWCQHTTPFNYTKGIH